MAGAGAISLGVNAMLRFLPDHAATILRAYTAWAASLVFAVCAGLLVAEAIVPFFCKG